MSFRYVCLSACLLALNAASQVAPPLSLDEAQRIAAREAPQLGAQAAAIRAARAAQINAGELPDPKLIVGIDNLPVEGGDRFRLNRDFMTMRRIGVMQDFTRSEKLQLRTQRAQAELRREELTLDLTEITLQREVALAWIDAYFADRQAALLKDLERETRLQVTASEAALAGGKAGAGDPFAAQLGLGQLADRQIDLERQAARARAMLARWVGTAAERPLAGPPVFQQLTGRHDQLLNHLDQLPHLALYAPVQTIADTEVKLAQAAQRPDWSLEVAYAQRGPDFGNMLSIGVRIDLPLFQSSRQDPAIAGRVALAEQVRAQAEAARREHAADIKAIVADWNAARQRAQRYEASLLPLARERTEVVLAAYRGGKGDLMPVIDARKADIDVQLAHLQVQADLARAWAQLNFQIPPSPVKDKP